MNNITLVVEMDTDAVGIVPYDKVGKEYAIKPYVYVKT